MFSAQITAITVSVRFFEYFYATSCGKEISVRIEGASYGTYRNWRVHPEFGYAYEKIVKDYILSSEKYNSMPPNENAYE